MTDDVRKLLGGYATGTLTEDEKKVLFDAALQDDALFAALADEHALKELLDDSAIRAQVLQATEDPRFSVISTLREWFDSPKSKALVATAAVLLVIIGFNQVRRMQSTQTSTPMMAELRRPAPAAPPSEASAPAPGETVEPRSRKESPAPRPPRQPTLADTQPSAALDEAPKRDQPAAVRENEQKREAPLQAAAPPPPAPLSVVAPPAARTEKSAVAATVGGNSASAAGVVAGNLAIQAPEIRSADGARSFRSTAPPPSVAGAGAMQRIAGTSVTPLRYELLRRDATGTFQAVTADYLFTPGDMVRLRVTSSRDGAVGVSTNTTTATVSRAVVANTWTEVPQSGGILVTADTAKVIVAFEPVASDNLMETDAARAKRNAPLTVVLEIPIRQKKP